METRCVLCVFAGAVLLTSYARSDRREKRFMPYIYPSGSVIQFAMGLALPADVKGRNVATNSGILINIDLPTNLSQLRPPSRSVRSAEGHRLINSQVAALLGLSGTYPSSNRCFEELDCYRRTFTRSKGLVPEIIVAILGTVLLHVRVCGFPIPWIQYSSAKVLWTCYDILVFMFSVYAIACSGYSIALRATFQDLCSLGIVVSQMTNGILITFHYLSFQGKMRGVNSRLDSLTQRILSSPLGHRDAFVLNITKDRDLLTTFTRVSITFNLLASILYVLPLPLMDHLAGTYRARLPIPMVFLGQPEHHRPVIFELIVLQEVLVLIYSSIKKNGNDCIFLSFFKIQSAYIKYLSLTMRTLGEELVTNGGVDKDKKLGHWISLHKDVINCIQELVSLYAPLIVLYYTNLICIIAFGLFVQLKMDNVDTIQSLATALWAATLIFVLFLQSAVADELREESDKLANEAYFIPWHRMSKEVVNALRMVILNANHPIHITGYRAYSFILNKETFLAFMANVITVYMGFSKIDDILNESK